MDWDFGTVQGLYSFGRYLLGKAAAYGASETARLLEAVFSTYWGSNLEALGEYRSILHMVKAEVTE